MCCTWRQRRELQNHIGPTQRYEVEKFGCRDIDVVDFEVATCKTCLVQIGKRTSAQVVDNFYRVTLRQQAVNDM
jgi:hypothetical protein